MNVGTLTIEMAANVARLKQDMEAARKSVEGTMSGIRDAAAGAAKALGAIGVGLSVAAFANWIRSAIDAADETSKLAQKAGLAVNQVAGLQLAFRQSGLEAGALQTSMSKLSVAIAGGSDELKAMGIQTKNTDGTLKTTREILGQVADRFAEYEDGAAKTALAVQIFGKSGADLIPLLNGGSEALDEFDAMARKLGLTLDDETAKNAEKFNDTLDLMGQGLVGIGRQIAAQILPTLTKLADNFFTTMTEGDRLKRVADALAFGMKGLYSVAIVVIEAFVSVGKTLGAVGGQIMAVMHGDFAQAAQIGNEWAADVKNDWVGALKNLEGVWSDTGDTSIDTMVSMAQAARKTAPVINEETKKQAAEQQKLQEQYKKLIDSIEEKTAVLMAEQGQTEKLTDAQKTALKVMMDIQNGTLKLTDEQKRQVTASLEQLLATEKVNEELKRQDKMLEEAAKENASFLESLNKTTEKLIEEAEKQRESNEEITLGKAAVERLKIEKLREAAASLERKAALAEEAWLGEEVVNGYRDQAKALRNLADLKEEGIHVQTARDARDAWNETTKTIESSLTDALMRGFESGKDFGKNLADTLVNMFKTLVLRPIIQPIAQGASNIILKMMGMALPGSAAAGGGGGSSGGMMSGFALSMSQFGSYMGTGFMNAITGNGMAGFGATQSLFANGSYAQAAGMGFGTLAGYGAGAMVGVGAGRAISNGYAISGSGNGLVNAGTAAGMLIGGPIGAAIGGAIAGAVNRAFGRKQTDMGIQGTLTTSEGLEGQTYKFLKGGWFRSNKTILEPLSNDIEAIFDGSIQMIAKQTRSYAAALGLPADAIDNFTQEIKLSFQGLSEEQINQKIQETLSTFQEGLAEQYRSALEPLQIAGETFSQTIERLMAIQNVSAALNEFGGAFTTFATASVIARQNIIELAGGLEQLVAKTQGFIVNFYTREEQAGITARGVVQALEASGFTAAQIASLETRQDFRALLESIDVNTDLGQKQFVALLDLQQSYSDLAPFMEEQSKSLAELIEAAPQVAMLQKMFETDAEYQNRIKTAEEIAIDLQQQLVDTMGGVDISIQNLSVIMANGLDRIATSTAIAIAEANAAAANAIAAANASAAAAVAAAEKAAADAAAAAAAAQYDIGGAATGGFISGPTLVGEHGPEIFNPQTSQVYTAPATANMLGGGEVAAEIRALRDEVALMRYETKATAVNTSKIARLQDNWDVRGLTVRTDADQPLDTVAV